MHKWFHLVLGGVGVLLCASACTDSSMLAGKLCDESGRCLSGYVCDPSTNRCVKEGTLPDGVDGGDGEDAGDQDGADSVADIDFGDFDPGDIDFGDRDIVVPEPIVLHTFGEESTLELVPDEAGRDPQLDLYATDRDPVGIAFSAGAVLFSGGRMEVGAPASKGLTDALVATGSFTVEAWVSTWVTEQFGPAVMVTLSSGASTRAFTLAQEGSDLLVRLRTSITDQNGEEKQHHVPVFNATGYEHLVFSYDGSTGQAGVYVNGRLQDALLHEEGDGSPATLDWRPMRERFGLGDEFGAEGRWVGALHKVTVWDVALEPDQVLYLYWVGPG
jgi:hypothetical protein